MAVIVSESGFAPDDWPEARRISVEDLPLTIRTSGEPLGVDLANDRDPALLEPWLDRLALVRVAFPAMGDGRGFSIARRLRAMGYKGRLRAAGPLIVDQLRAARRVGFDEIELPDAVAERQPESLWQTGRQGSYQDRLMG